MNKSELVDALADRTGMTKADAARAVDALFATDGGVLSDALKRGARVQITGFGTFEAKERKVASIQEYMQKKSDNPGGVTIVEAD